MTERWLRVRRGVALLLLLASCASNPSEPASAAPAPAAAPTITFAEGRLGYGGRTIEFPASLDQVIELFGPPSRTIALGNTIDTWDDLGVHVYRKSGETLVNCVNVSLAPQASAFSPHSPFTGRIELPGGSIGRESTSEELRAAGLRRSPVPGESWEAKPGRFAIGVTRDQEVVEAWLAWRGPDPHHVTGPPLGEDDLFVAEARAYDFNFDETLREVSHAGNVSIVRVEGASSQGSVGRSFFVAGAIGELARRRGFSYVVVLNVGAVSTDESLPPDSTLLGFTNEAEPDIAREFSKQFVAGRSYDVTAADAILDLLPNWPDGGKAATLQGGS
jgi:hypothetical protein